MCPTAPEMNGLTLIDRDHLPTVVQPVNAGQRQGIDDKTERGIRRNIERDCECGANGPERKLYSIS